MTSKNISFCILTLQLLSAAALAQDARMHDVAESSQSQIEDLKQGTALGATELAQARPLNAVSIALIKATEGWVAHAYDDPSHYCTIGYGHLIALQPCSALDLGALGFAGSIADATGSALLSQDTTSARIAVSSLVSVDLNQDQFGALVSLVFNIGKGNFQNSTLRKILNAHAFDLVPGELKRWSSSNGKVLPGLLKRRQCEGDLFNSSLHLDESGRINLDSCGTLGAAADITNPIDILKGETK